ncbi:hybrid sensor histidine kinase/response regulator transcription factor [Sphingobacterium lumbrici]|uniref:hybrid sensor histidine kinase/response regulator transcription factor n=1 Tax=Sphingobacterium lumbrici TaxID=2559600 RepID=UPI00112CFA32|nr:two-component regulator propeller domain-containing protein [Sphingobacterium lumbrici]
MDNMKRAKAALLLVMMIVVPLFCCIGQLRHFHSMNVKDGLSQSGVLDIVQDDYGFMWFATRHGLNRYDGLRFKIYNHDKKNQGSLVDDYVNAVCKDSRGRLWVATSKGLDLYDTKQDCFVHLVFEDSLHAGVKRNVLRLLEDHKGNLWIGTDQGLYMLKNADPVQQAAHVQSIVDSAEGIGNDIWVLYEDTKQHLWVSSDKGLTKMISTGQQLKPVRITALEGHKHSTIRSIVEDDFGNIWFGTESDGLYRLNVMSNSVANFRNNTGQANTLVHNSVRKILKCNNGQLAIGTQGGLSILDVSTLSFSNSVHLPQVKYSLSQNSIYSLYEDEQGSLWVGTYFGGINVSYAGFTPFHDLFTENPAVTERHQVMRAITSDRKGNIWIGSEGGGVSKWNPKDNRISHYNISAKKQELTGNLVKTIYIDRTGNIWIGTSGGGLKLLEGETSEPRFYNLGLDSYKIKRSAILSIYEDRSGLFWIGGLGYNRIYKKQGVDLIDVTPKHIREAFDTETILSIYEGKEGNLWLLTEHKVYLFDFRNNSLEKVLEDQSDFTSIVQDHVGVLWIGKYYGGLIGYDPVQKKVRYRFDQETGLTNNNVVGLIEDSSGKLWIATQSGLNQLNSDRERLRSFTGLDGVQSEEFNYNAIHIVDDRLYLGSLNGLAYFNLDELAENSSPAKIVFSGLRLFNGVLEQPDIKSKLLKRNIVDRPTLTFTAQQNIFTIEFSLLSYIKSVKNRYAYKLDGVGDQWTFVENGEATFTNLPAGEYTLLVRGQNNDGIWSSVNSIDFKVLPPLWKTWWAYLFYIVAIGTLVFMAVRYMYLQALQQKEQQLHQFKMNFFSNISHEIRSHLTLIMAPIENALFLSSGTKVVESNLQQAKDSVTRLLRLVNELMDFRKAESQSLALKKINVDIEIFLEEIVRPFEQLAKDRNIVFNYTHSISSIVVGLDPFQFEKVLFNLLSNALKYTSEKGIIDFTAAIKDNLLTLTVQNTGKGIRPEHFDKIFENYFQIEKKDQETGYGIGLALSRHIVLLHGGKIWVESQAGITRFIITLPYSKVSKEDDTLKVPTHLSDGIAVVDKKIEYAVDLEHATPKVLLIEDNPELLHLVVDLLRDRYEVITAADGEEGLEQARTVLPELVISDVMMPRRNGIELCEALKNDPLTSHIPVILLTAMTGENDQITGLNSRADAYLTKPYNREILLLHIRNLLESRYQIQQKYRQEFVIGPRNIVINTIDEEFLSRFISVIETGLDVGQFDVEHLVDKMAMSQSVLYKKVRALTGMTINDFSKSIRLKRAAALLEQRVYAVSEVSIMVGFMDSKYFAKEFKKYFGMSPSQYMLREQDDK